MKLFSVRWRQAGQSALLCVLVLAASTASAARATLGKARYARRVRCTLNQPLAFPDFTLRCTGATHENSPVFPPGFTYENFVVEAGGKAQKVVWCGGTGIPAPSVFVVGRRSFQLELGYPEHAGKGVPEVVVSPARRR